MKNTLLLHKYLSATCAFQTMLAMIATTSILTSAIAQEIIDYQKIADGARWGWQEEMADPLGCISQCGNKYDITLRSKKGDRYSYTITIILGDRQVFTWDGHRHSVFRILDDQLYYARFHPSSSGGSIVAVDLKTGKELWASPLQALGPIQHSAYSNLMTLDANHDVVMIYGKESMGKYFEAKDAVTGKTVGNKIFPKESSNKSE